ncbi:MAG: putative LPS assembly protein LptD [Bacteroidota bacterium]
MSAPFFGYSQKDTVYTTDHSIENIIKATSKDSMIQDRKNNQLHLYGEAVIFYEDIVLSADYLLVDFSKNEVFASYSYDKDSNRVGLPKFTDGTEEIIAAKIRYNFDTKKGYIQEVKIKQDENYLYMEVAKRHSNEEVHFKQGRFTTCDLDEPHYHFQLSKAIMIPEKRIVSGPMNLWIKGVPTPLGLPFIFIPQKKVRQQNKGFLFPQVSVQSPYGMGFQNLGYYLPVNDSLHTTFYADLYTRGTWGARNQTSYKVRYKYQGDLNVGFQRLKSGFLDTLPVKKITFIWTHRQDAKSNPLWNFSAGVNFISDNNPKANLDPLNQNYFQNSLNSDINISRIFPGKPITMGLKISARQNSFSHNFAVTAPVYNMNVTRFSPFTIFRRSKLGSKKWYEQIVMTYNLEAQNRATFQDTLVKQKRYDLIRETFLNGVSQSSTMQTTIGLFRNTWKLNPSITYSNKVNFQQVQKSYDALNNTTLTDTVRKTGMAQSFSANVQLTTVLYSYYRFVGKNKPLLRHILTPSFSFRYVPLLNKTITDSIGFNKTPVTYSPFERSVYPDGSTANSAFLSFGFNNTFELKRKSEKDTITGFRKTKLIEGWSFNGSYDLLKDSMKLSRISSNLRISPVEFINIVANAGFSPYNYNDSTNLEIDEYLVSSRGRLARLYSVSINTNFILTTRKSREKIKQNSFNINENWNADFQYYALHPDQWIDFEIPWRLTLGHILDLNRSTSPFTDKRQFKETQTLSLNADVSVTKRWKLLCDSYYDIKTGKIINTRLTITRNMHCWNLAFYWTPVGLNQSFLFRINATSSLFQDAKMELRKPPALF